MAGRAASATPPAYFRVSTFVNASDFSTLRARRRERACIECHSERCSGSLDAAAPLTLTFTFSASVRAHCFTSTAPPSAAPPRRFLRGRLRMRPSSCIARGCFEACLASQSMHTGRTSSLLPASVCVCGGGCDCVALRFFFAESGLGACATLRLKRTLVCTAVAAPGCSCNAARSCAGTTLREPCTPERTG